MRGKNEDKPISRLEWLKLHLVGGRISKQKSHAAPSKLYFDPQQSVKFDKENKKHG
jgi:hypothetical protein